MSTERGLAAAHDVWLLFTMVAKAPEDVRPADVLVFITAQRTGRSGGADERSRRVAA